MRAHILVAAVLLTSTTSTRAQSGGFVAALGRDTVQVERFTRTGNIIEGTVVYRSPVTRVVKYTLQFGIDGRPVKYEQSIFAADGKRLEPNNGNATMVFSKDTITRETTRGGEPVKQQIAAPNGAIPLLGGSLMIPFAYSYLTYELAFARARSGTPTGETR